MIDGAEVMLSVLHITKARASMSIEKKQGGKQNVSI
jgi:hypothetical protein